MPIEYEFKYILSLDIQNASVFNELKAKMDVLNIEQGYLVQNDDMGLRIRRTLEDTNEYNQGYEMDYWNLTLKQEVDDKTIEIECVLSTSDALALWSKCAGKLKKKRHVCKILNDVDKGDDYSKWEIDFFYDEHDSIYFALAEIELDFASERPDVPNFLKDFIIYEVPLTDNRFSNKKLGDVKYAECLYQKLRIKNEN